MLTIAPRPCASIRGSTHLQVRNMLLTLTVITRSHMASLVSTGPPWEVMPTLLCSTSTRPQASSAAATACCTSGSSVTSAATASASPPSARIASQVAWAASRRWSTATTRAPLRA